MPIDASIPLGVRPMQVEPPANALARILQLKGLQQEQELGTMKLDEHRRGIERQTAMDRILSGGGDAKALRQGGFLKEANEWEKTGADTEHKRSETAKNTADIENKTIAVYRDASQAITDPQTAAEFVRTMHGDPRLQGSAVARVPLEKLLAQVPQDPAQLAAWKQQFALGATKFMELNAPKLVTSNTGQQTVTTAVEGLTGVARPVQTLQNTATPGDVLSSQDRAAALAEQRRAHNMTDARAREAADIQRNQPRGQFIETTNGYVLADPKSGGVRPVLGPDGQPLKGKAADRSLNETQAKANLFGTRMKEADRILTSMEGKYSPAAVNAKMAAGELPLGVGAVAGPMGNLMLSAEGQQAEQAQRDFINAVLRRESGAAIATTEFSNAQKQYFPQPGDTPQVLAQKKRNRQLAIQGLEVEVPGGFRSSPHLTNPAGNTGGASGGWGGGPGKVVDFGELK